MTRQTHHVQNNAAYNQALYPDPAAVPLPFAAAAQIADNQEHPTSLGTVTFTGDAGTANFDTPGNWSGDQVPGEDQVASIGAGFTEVIIPAPPNPNENPIIGGLILAAGDSLVIGDGAQLSIGSGLGTATATNSGNIVFGSDTSSAVLDINAPEVILNGGGTLDLLVQNNQSDNVVTAGTTGNTLDNVNNTIEGAGLLGGNELTIINGAKGVIDANTSQSLTLVAGSTVMNSGLLETDINTGNSLNGLIIEGTVNGAGGGTISATAGNVLLEGGTVAGGTITSTGTNILAITVSGYGLFDGTAHAITNNGDVQVEGDNTLALLGTLKNNGTLSLSENQYGNAYLAIGPATGATGTATVSGTGTLLLTENAGNYIQAGQAGNTLVNASLIAGSGSIGNGSDLVMTNSGTIDATGTISLFLNSTGILTNTGLLESSSPPTGGSPLGLVIEQAIVDGKAGTIAASGGEVILQSGSISGGTLSSTGAYQVQVTVGGSFTLNGATSAITNIGQLAVEGANTLYVLGSLVNTGTVSLNSNQYGNAVLAIGPTTGAAGTVTLSGKGELLLTEASGNVDVIQAAQTGNTLVNGQLIAGSGFIGSGSTLNVTNNGTIDATGTLSLDLNSAGVLTNNGLLKSNVAPGGGSPIGLIIDQVVHNSATAKISAAGGNVLLEGGSISGGTLSSTGTNEVYVTVGGGFTLDGATATITNTGQLAVEGDNVLTLLGSLVNTGTFSLDYNSNGNAVLSVGPATGAAGTVTLSGSGQLLLSEAQGGGNYIVAGQAGNTLVNNQLITGSGTIGNGSALNITNNGTIDATGTLALVLNSAGLLTNNGLLEATNVPAGDSLVGLIIDQAIQNAGGQIAAVGGNVLLEGGSIAGGTISSTGTNFVAVTVGGGFTLDGTASAVTNTGQFIVAGDNTLTVLGSLINNGTLALDNNQYGNAVLAIGPASGKAGTVTLSGSGQLLLNEAGGSGNYIVAAQSGETLVNDQLITGSGVIGNNAVLNVINNGTIDATGTLALVLNSTGLLTNNGLLEATNVPAGDSLVGLIIEQAIQNAGGTIAAVGGNVLLESGSIAGGTISSTGTNIVAVTVGGGFTLDGSASAVTNTGQLIVAGDNTLTALRSLINNGTLALDDNQYGNAVLAIGPATGKPGTFTLSGSGTLLMNDSNGNYIVATQSGATFINGETISGAGTIGNGAMNFINNATVEATGANALVINLGGNTGTNSTGAQWLGEGAGGLTIENGTYTNQGTIAALDGSSVSFASNAVLTNSVKGALTGGTYEAIATTHGATLSVSGAAVTKLGADIVLSGANSTIDFGGVAIGAKLKSIGAKGTLTVDSNASLAITAKTLTDAGMISLGGGTLTATGVKVAAASQLNGYGTLGGSINDAGTVHAAGGTLDITKILSGTGKLQIANGATAAIGGSLTVASTVFASGMETLELAKAATTTTTISGYGSGDIVDLTSTAATSLQYSGSASSGTLLVLDGKTTVATLQFTGDYSINSFELQSAHGTATITGTGQAPLQDFGLNLQNGSSMASIAATEFGGASHGPASDHFDPWLSFSHLHS